MFSYYGSKSKLVNLYPPPRYGKIIEPFAGSARYALKYFDRDILLVDAYDAVIRMWKYLQQASEKDILHLPSLTYKQSTDDVKWLSDDERLLLGFMCARGMRRPVKIVQQYSDIEKDKRRIAGHLHKIRHWVIQLGVYQDIPNQDVTWFIDPPYQAVGKAGYNVQERGLKVDYDFLSEWCRSRQGQAVVCEITSADWLPFTPIKTMRGQKLTTTEAIWTNDALSTPPCLF